MAHPAAGASLEVGRPEPSVDLAALLECLADAIPLPTTGRPFLPSQGRPMFSWRPSTSSGALSIDTAAAIRRLTTSKGFRQLKPGADAGFLRDAPVPRRRTPGHIGGRIVDGTGGRVRTAVERLVNLIDAELEHPEIPKSVWTLLASSTPDQVLREIGAKINCEVAEGLQGQTRLHRTLLDPVGETQERRRAEVARTMTAIEEIVGDRTNHFEHMASAVGELLRAEQHSDRDIGAALATLRQHMETPDSQVARFFDFLEDEALARVRLHVTYRLMDVIAECASSRLDTVDTNDMRALIAYVRRARALFSALGAAGGEDVLVNVASQFGDQADFSLSEEVSLSARLVSRYRWRTLRLRLLTGTHPQRAALQRALAPVVRDFLPLLDKAGQEVRAIVLVPTLSNSDGEPLAAEVEQLGGSAAFIVRLAHRVGSTLRQPDEVAGALAEDLLYLYRHAAAVSVVRQTPAAASQDTAIQSAAVRKPVGRNGLATLPHHVAQNEAEGTVVQFKPNPLGPRNGQSS